MMVQATKAAVKKSPEKKSPGKKSQATLPKLKVTQVKSVIGTKESHRACVRGLGLRRLNQTVEVEDTPAVRGMINKVYYLIKCNG